MKPYITNSLVELNEGAFIMKEGENYFLVEMAMISPQVVGGLVNRRDVEPIPPRTFVAEHIVPTRKESCGA